MSLQKELGFPRPIIHRAHEALLSVVVTGNLLTREAQRALAPYGITEAQFNVLMILTYQSEDGGMSQTDLGRMLLVNRSNVTGLVDRMEKAGWVRRIPSPSDRRMNRVEITPEGTGLLERAHHAYYGRVETIMRDLPDTERRGLVELTEKVRRGIRNQEG